MLDPSLSPYAFTVFGFGVHWYSLFMAFSMAMGALWAAREGRRLNMDLDAVMDFALYGLIGAIIGARVVFVLANDPVWIVRDPVQILKVYQGGLAWDGGVLGGIVGAGMYMRRHGLTLAPYLDLAVPGLAFGYALVRIGNIFNHEVYGRMTQLGFGRWPAQFIGSGIGVILLVRYFLERRRGGRRPGEVFWGFMFWYTVLRAVVEEPVRQNPLYLVHVIVPRWGLGFTTLMQLFTPAILVIAGFMWRRCAHGSARPAEGGPAPAAVGEEGLADPRA